MSSITVLLPSRFFLAGVDDIKCPFPNRTMWIFFKSHDISTWDLHRDLHLDLARREWGLNPWSSVYETDALPLGHHATWIRVCALYKIFNFSYSMRIDLSSFTLLLLYRSSLAESDYINCPFPNVTIWIFCKSHDISTWDLHLDLHRDLARREWGLNPWSSVYETDAFPLGPHATCIRICALYKIFNFSYSMRFY